MTPQVLEDSDENLSAAGFVAVQKIFDDATKRFAEMYEDWQRSSRAALRESRPAAADPVEPLTAEIPQAA